MFLVRNHQSDFLSENLNFKIHTHRRFITAFSIYRVVLQVEIIVSPMFSIYRAWQIISNELHGC